MARTCCSINTFLLALVALCSIGLVSACENTARGLKEDAAAAEVATRDERAQATATAKAVASEVAQEAREAARGIGAVARSAGEEVAERASGAGESIDVKAALMADTAVDSTRINVDVSTTARTVTLNGAVPTAGERTRAERIARDKAPNFKVVNNLEIRPRS